MRRVAAQLCRTAISRARAPAPWQILPSCSTSSSTSSYSKFQRNTQLFRVQTSSLNSSFLLRHFSSVKDRDELLEEEAERKIGWFLKLIFVGTASLVAFQFFPYMGDNLLQQSISLLHVKDPLFKRMGASRLTRFAVDDERRMKVVELGGAEELLNMLESAKDDKTRMQALKALVALSHSDAAAQYLQQAGAIPMVSSTPNSVEYAEVEAYKFELLKRFENMKTLASTSMTTQQDGIVAINDQ